MNIIQGLKKDFALDTCMHILNLSSKGSHLKIKCGKLLVPVIHLALENIWNL